MHMVERVRYPCKFFMDVDKIDGIDMKLIDYFISKYPTDEFIICINEINTGIHIIFQNKTVSSPEEAIKECKIECDKTVYRTGLRMIGSKKKKKISGIIQNTLYLKEK